jgi:hypothetical protein
MRHGHICMGVNYDLIWVGFGHTGRIDAISLDPIDSLIIIQRL